MKFEKIDEPKFKMFDGSKLQNVAAIVGGAEDTSNQSAGTFDTKVGTNSSGRADSAYETTASGSPRSSDTGTSD